MSDASDRSEKKKLVDEAREWFKFAREADEKQRERERADVQFYDGDQWPADVKNARKGSSGPPAVPARPCLTINKVRQPVAITTNQERQSEIGVEITAADDFSDTTAPVSEEEIELREGLVRRIQRESNAAAARSWAFSRAVIAGRGYYAVMTRYLPGKTADQEVYVHRIYNQDSVTLDPAHEEPDGSDCEKQAMGAWMPLDLYKATYPHAPKKPNKISGSSDSDFTEWAEKQPDWVKMNGDTRAVYILDFYYFELESKELSIFADGTSEWTSALADDDPRPVVDTCIKVEKTAKWCKLDGINDAPLEETVWPSPYLPIIKVLGEELHPYDEERRAEGMVRPMRDSGEGFNAMASKLVEVVAYAPIAPIIGAAGFDEDFTEEWDLSTTRSIGRLHYNVVMSENGQPAPPPQATPREAPVAPIAAALQMFDVGIKSTTGVPDPTLGNVDSSLKSGRAIKALQASSQMGTSNFMDNLTRSVRHEGRIENSLLFPIYGQRPGRLLRIVTGQGESQPIAVGHPFTMQQGRPVLAPSSPAPADSKLYQLTQDAQFNVNVKVTKNYETRRDQQNAVLGEIIGSDPNQMAIVGDLLYASMEDLPQHKEMAERAEVMLAPPVQAMLQAKKNGQQPLPPQVQQQLDQAKQGTAALMQRIQDLEKEKDAKVIELQGKIALTNMQLEAAAVEKAKDRETKLAVAELGAKVDRLTLFMDERARLGDNSHDAALSSADAMHDRGMATMGAATDAASSAQNHTQTMVQGAQAGQQALDQGQQAADLAPSPQADGAGE